jgi:hypothetical protein
VEDSRLASGDPRPRFDILQVSVPGHVHLGLRGELKLRFFNDRLSSAWFYPDDVRGYLDALAGAGVKVIEAAPDTEQKVAVAPYTNVWATRDFGDRLYVGWEDKRLSDQERRWIERYS